MLSPGAMAESTKQYTMEVTLKSSEASHLIASLEGGDDAAIIGSVPLREMLPYSYEVDSYDEVLVTAQCVKSGDTKTVRPSNEEVSASFAIEGRWSPGLASENTRPNLLVSDFSIEIADLSEVHTLGKVNADCKSESATKKGVKAKGSFTLEVGSGRSAHYELSNGYSINFKLKEH